MPYQPQVRAANNYNKKHTFCVLIRLNKNTDADIIQQLDGVPSKMGYIKGLIRADIKKR